MRTSYLYVLALLSLACSCGKKDPHDFNKENNGASREIAIPPYKLTKDDSASLEGLALSMRGAVVSYSMGEFDSLQKTFPSEFEVKSLEKGDMNADGLVDYLAVLGKDGGYDDYGSGKVLIYLRQKDGSLRLQAVNTSYVPRQFMGFQADIDSVGNGFTISGQTSGMGRHAIVSDATAHFTYSKKMKDWVLRSHCLFLEVLGGIDLVDEDGNPVLDEDGYPIPDTTAQEPEVIHMSDIGEECTHYKTQRDFGTVRFSRFDISTLFDE